MHVKFEEIAQATCRRGGGGLADKGYESYESLASICISNLGKNHPTASSTTVT